MASVRSERTLYTGHPKMFRSEPVHFVAAVLLIPFVVGAIDLVRWWLRSLGTSITITTQKTSLRKGILSRDLNEVLHANVRNVQLRQTFFQRLMNVGTIGISSSGQSGVEIEIDGIHDPMRIKRMIESRGADTGVESTAADWAGPAVLAGGGVMSTIVCWFLISAFWSAAKPLVVAPDHPRPAQQPVVEAQPASRPAAQAAMPAAVDQPVVNPQPVVPKETDEQQAAREDAAAEELKKHDEAAAETKRLALDKEAARKLDEAKLLIRNDKTAAAARRLKEIIEKFADTLSAKEAEELLKKIK